MNVQTNGTEQNVQKQTQILKIICQKVASQFSGGKYGLFNKQHWNKWVTTGKIVPTNTIHQDNLQMVQKAKNEILEYKREKGKGRGKKKKNLQLLSQTKTNLPI